jgi:DNA polymerase-3 subunit alpha
MAMQEEYAAINFSCDEYMETIREALDNTNEIASMIEDIKLGSDHDLFPNLQIPGGMTAEGYITMTSFQNLYKYKKKDPSIDLETYERRLNYELHVINTIGYAPYVLTVQDYIQWANEHGCPTGPGRGSGAGSLVCFLLGITKMIDPIKYNLLFFRFLTPDRTSPPDIDTDFEYYHRDDVIHYLEDKYGKECVCHIGTYTEMGVKNGIKDVGRVLSLPFEDMNTLTSKVDEWAECFSAPKLRFKDLDGLEGSTRENEIKAYNEYKEAEARYPELFRLARTYEGTPRNPGVHASGILITPMPVNDMFPTRVDKEGTKITLYTGPQLEELKAIKFDLLGLRTLSVIQQTLQFIDKNLTFDDIYDSMNIDDEGVFKNIQAKETEGVFQIESNLFKGMIEGIVPNTMNDIVAITSLGRPGPLSAGMDKSYAKRKHGEEEAKEPLPNTWDIVKDTYGTICYQEQIMMISKVVASFNDNQADTYLRKGFAKKKRDKMEMCRQWFIYGKINQEAPEDYDKEDKNQPEYDPDGKHGPAIIGGIGNGYDEQQLVDFWHNIEGFADYLFNKSHAACYSYITVVTGWLKTYYPTQFMAALLSVQEGQNAQEKIALYSKIAKNMGISIKVPDINLSDINFKPIKKTILYGLKSIKGVGASSIPDIIANRPYVDLNDALVRVGKKSFNKRVAVALIKSGAFNFVNTNRNELINMFYDLRKDKDERLDVNVYTEEKCMEYERDVLGTTITYVPEWEELKPGKDADIILTINSVQEKTDKRGGLMAFVNGTTQGCAIRCVVFAKTYARYADKFDKRFHTEAYLHGKKDDRGAFVVDKVLDRPATERYEDTRLESIFFEV